MLSTEGPAAVYGIVLVLFMQLGINSVQFKTVYNKGPNSVRHTA